jgi:ubiquinone/menaquinone biosynthesis C-methylase UbiE
MQRVLEPEVMDTPEEADGYDSMDHSEPNASFVARLLELGARGSILDIGCGPGHIPLLVLARVPDSTILGVDLAHHMLRHAERHRGASPFAHRLRYEIADAKKLPYADASFDTVYSNTILHHIPDPRPYVAEAYRVLRPGGALLIRDLFRPSSPERASELVKLHAAGANPYQQELFRASLHAAFTPAELESLAVAAGMQRFELVVDTDRHMSLQIRRTRA